MRRAFRRTSRPGKVGLWGLLLLCVGGGILALTRGGGEGKGEGPGPAPDPGARSGRPLERSSEGLPPDPDQLLVFEEVARAVHRNDLPPVYRERLLVRLPGLAARAVFSTDGGAFTRPLEVQAKDSYWRIAQRLAKDGVQVSPGLLVAINQRPPERLREGTTIQVPTSSTSIIVDKSDHLLFLLLGDVCIKAYPAGLGRDDKTPVGEYRIGTLVKNPDWTDPKTGRTFRFGEAGHEIGNRWLGFEREGKPNGLGIHGTIDPASVGRSVSEGCIRLGTPDLEALFDLVAEGNLVRVRP